MRQRRIVLALTLACGVSSVHAWASGCAAGDPAFIMPDQRDEAQLQNAKLRSDKSIPVQPASFQNVTNLLEQAASSRAKFVGDKCQE